MIDENKLRDIQGLWRNETVSREGLGAHSMELTHAVYPHDQLFGQYCSIQEYIQCPPGDLFNYLCNIHSLEEWTYSTREFRPTDQPGLYVGIDTLEADTKIFCRVESNEAALTVDYHCAWDQGEELWMIYLMRIVPAELVLKKPGSILFWANCRHPYYDDNPFPDKTPSQGRPWVGDYWDLFYAGHTVEMGNLKRIVEHRHAAGGGLGPFVKSNGG